MPKVFILFKTVSSLRIHIIFFLPHLLFGGNVWDYLCRKKSCNNNANIYGIFFKPHLFLQLVVCPSVQYFGVLKLKIERKSWKWMQWSLLCVKTYIAYFYTYVLQLMQEYITVSDSPYAIINNLLISLSLKENVLFFFWRLP